MKRFFSGLFAALVVVLSAAPFLYVFMRSFLSPGGVTFQYYYDVFSGFPKISFFAFGKASAWPCASPRGSF